MCACRRDYIHPISSWFFLSRSVMLRLLFQNFSPTCTYTPVLKSGQGLHNIRNVPESVIAQSQQIYSTTRLTLHVNDHDSSDQREIGPRFAAARFMVDQQY